MPIAITVDCIRPGQPELRVLDQTFYQNEVLIGRAETNDVILPTPEVSGTHAKLVIRPAAHGEGESLWVNDLNSSNGTYIEDTQVPSGGLVEIGRSERVIVGSYLISAGILEASDATAVHTFKTEEKEAQETTHDGAAKSSVDLKKEVSRRDRFEEEFRIRRVIHDQLIERLDLRRKDIVELSEEDLRKRARAVVEDIIIDLRWELPEGLERESLIKQVLDEALALGPLEELLADDSCSEVMVNNYQQIFAERDGRLTLTDLRFSSEQGVLGAIERILAPIGRRIDESSPMVDARLKDGSRVNAVIRPLALSGPCITIRKFAKEALRIEDMVAFGSMSSGMAEFLRLAVSSRMNIVISGGTGSGKTTMLNIISSFIPDGERVITVEDAAELRLPQEHLISFETRPPNLEGRGAVTIRDLVRNALRMRPDRIIVGECRGPEALDMLQAMNTGHDGSMTTGHANSPADMIRRLETMVLTSGVDIPVRAVREQIASAVNLVLQLTRFSCGSRKITTISEVVGMDYDDGTVMLEDIFTFCQEGYGDDGRVKGYHQATGYIPKFFRALQERGLPVNADVFSPGRIVR